jgi:hypothetical protein
VADGVQRGAGLRRLSVPQVGGGLGGQLQADEGLGHRVVQVTGEAAPFALGGRARRARGLFRAVPRHGTGSMLCSTLPLMGLSLLGPIYSVESNSLLLLRAPHVWRFPWFVCNPECPVPMRSDYAGPSVTSSTILPGTP